MARRIISAFVVYVDLAFRRALATVARNGHLVSDWTLLCRYLGLDDLEIETIAYRYTGARERCHQSLIRWTELAVSSGQHLGVNVLLQVLRRCNSHQLAGLYHQSSSTFFVVQLVS